LYVQIAGMSALWKQLRNVRDSASDNEKDAGVFSVAHLMSIPTPPKYLAYRLSPKMEEYLIFMMVRNAKTWVCVRTLDNMMLTKLFCF
jgi:hypothetical protein